MNPHTETKHQVSLYSLITMKKRRIGQRSSLEHVECTREKSNGHTFSHKIQISLSNTSKSSRGRYEPRDKMSADVVYTMTRSECAICPENTWPEN